MPRRPTRTARPAAPLPAPSFRFGGFFDGWYALRADLAAFSSTEGFNYRSAVIAWMWDEGITAGTWGHLANGNTGDYPVVPAFEDGSGLCLLLKRPADVIRLAKTFTVDYSVARLHRAMQAEADVHRFIVADIARIAYEATRQLALVFNETRTAWDELSDDLRQLIIQRAREHLEHPERTAQSTHEAWVDRRLLEGWHYAADLDLKEKRHPHLVPFNKLPPRERARQTLFVSTVASLVNLLDT
jgi:hypothetical protein